MKRGSDDQFDKEPHGRIPESLIDAALDGEICDQMQEEIAHALQYDHGRRAELLETADAVRALDLDDIPMPDMQCLVLNRLDQQERFIPKTMRRWVRTGRLAVAAGVLLGLMLVAGMQSMYPRLTTIGAQSTPVDDVASAMAADSQRVAADVQTRVEILRGSMLPLDGLLLAPRSNGTKSFSLTLNHQLIEFSDEDLEAFYASGLDANELGVGFPVSHRPNQFAGSMTLVSYQGRVVGGDDCLLVGTQSVGAKQSGSVVVVQSSRASLKAPSDERIADLP